LNQSKKNDASGTNLTLSVLYHKIKTFIMDKITPIPEKLLVEQTFGQTTITVKWYTHLVWVYLLFALFWNSFIFIFVFSAPGFVMLFASLHIMAGIGIAWYAICLLVNKTVVQITSTQFSVVTMPLYFYGFGSKTIDRSAFKHVYVQEHKSNTKNGSSYSYKVHLLGHDGRSSTIPFSTQNADEALFIRSEIERIMKVERVPVEGEYLG
jgi:hypothetical protein